MSTILFPRDFADCDAWLCPLFATRCRKTQAIYDKCVFDKLGQERPPPGYFSKVRLHDTKRPKPVREIPLPEPILDPPEITDEATSAARARLKQAGVI